MNIEMYRAEKKIFVHGLVKFVPAVAYHFCHNLPETFSQPQTKTFSQLCMQSPRACEIYMRAAKLYPRFARVRFITIMNGDLRMQKCRQLLLGTFSIPPKKPFCQSRGGNRDGGDESNGISPNARRCQSKPLCIAHRNCAAS